MTADSHLHLRTAFGLKDGLMLAPVDVESGLACGCSCPECNARLIAKKGGKVAWHFAHHNAVATQSCVETAIHAAAKQVLLEANYLRAPEMRITLSRRTKSGNILTKSEVRAQSRTIRFDYCREEVWETSVRPDVIGYRGERRLLVEMFFTHEVDAVKRRKLEALGLPAIEIDLSNLESSSGFETVRQRVLHDIAEKEWLFFPGEKEAKAALSIALDEEVAEHNRSYERRLVEQKRKDEARRHQANQVRQAIAHANERYRLLPRAEKERLLRASLGQQKQWPYHLDRTSPESTAIGEPARIWQAALFTRFIFGKRTATFELDTLVEWVTERFGLVDNRVADLEVAVRKYLGYLRACGFLNKSYFPYETLYYEVIHDDLTAPLKPKKRQIESMRAAPISPSVMHGRRASIDETSAEVHWSWRASWPTKADILKAASSILDTSPHRELLLRTIEALPSHGRPSKTPLAFAQHVEEEGVAHLVTLDFLSTLGLVLKSSHSS